MIKRITQKKRTSNFIKKNLEDLYCYLLRSKVKNKNFTIISNNCWAGAVYEDLQMEYKTPTIGLFFYAPCYIKFLKNFNHYIKQPLTFKVTSIYEEAREFRKNNSYPLGVLDDIEVHFLHYKNQTEALEKWNRRIQRINYNNLFINFCDRDLCTEEHIREFDKLDFLKKVCFTAQQYPELKSVVWLKKYKDKPFVGTLYTDRWGYRRDFHLLKWLNKKDYH
jgi:uncharacterized protein (DUF1919 family)